MKCHQINRGLRTLMLGGLLAIARSHCSDESDSDLTDLGDLELYKISWLGPLSLHEEFNDENTINITTKHKHKYRCIVPDNEYQLNFDTSARNSSTANSKDVKDISPMQILGPLFKLDLCSYKFDLFWFYEICHGKYLRQYHETSSDYKSKVTQEYFLGKLDPEELETQIKRAVQEDADLLETGEARPKILVDGHYKPYVMLNMTGGTKCDLTKRPRVTKVIYVCSVQQSHELYSIKETSTCEYEAIVLSPFLCQHKDFKIDTDTQHEIKCYSLEDSPIKPPNVLEVEDEDSNEAKKNKVKKHVAYFQGRTLIIDADLLLG